MPQALVTSNTNSVGSRMRVMKTLNIRTSQKRSSMTVRPVILLLLLLTVVLTGCNKGPLYTELVEGDANDMLSILLRNGIESEKIRENKTGLFAIHVETEQTAVAIRVLKQAGFPREKFLKVDDLFKKDGLISSPLEERVRYIYALSQDVQETLARIDGVITARVHVVLPENDPFSDDIKPSSASVFIKYLPDSHLEDIKSEIKLIVEKSIEGLSYDKVSVVMLPSNENISKPGSAAWKSVMGVRMPAESVFEFKAIVFGLLMFLLVLLAFCMYLFWLVKTYHDSAQAWKTRESGDQGEELDSDEPKARNLLVLLDPRTTQKTSLKVKDSYAVRQ